MAKPIPIGSMPSIGNLPRSMFAQVVRQDRFGDPRTAFQIEEIDIPKHIPPPQTLSHSQILSHATM